MGIICGRAGWQVGSATESLQNGLEHLTSNVLKMVRVGLGAAEPSWRVLSFRAVTCQAFLNSNTGIVETCMYHFYFFSQIYDPANDILHLKWHTLLCWQFKESRIYWLIQACTRQYPTRLDSPEPGNLLHWDIERSRPVSRVHTHALCRIGQS